VLVRGSNLPYLHINVRMCVWEFDYAKCTPRSVNPPAACNGCHVSSGMPESCSLYRWSPSRCNYSLFFDSPRVVSARPKDVRRSPSTLSAAGHKSSASNAGHTPADIAPLHSRVQFPPCTKRAQFNPVFSEREGDPGFHAKIRKKASRIQRLKQLFQAMVI